MDAEGAPWEDVAEHDHGEQRASARQAWAPILDPLLVTDPDFLTWKGE